MDENRIEGLIEKRRDPKRSFSNQESFWYITTLFFN